MKIFLALLLFSSLAFAAGNNPVPNARIKGDSQVSGTLTTTGTSTFAAGSFLTMSATSTLTVNGVLQGTPTGGTLNLGSVTVNTPNVTGGITTSGTHTGLTVLTGSTQVGATGTPFAAIKSGTGSVSWGLINADSEVTAYLAVASATNTGLSAVELGWGAALDNGIYVKQKFVVSTGTVAIILGNEGTTSGGAVTVNNRTVRATVIQYLP